MTSAGTPPTPDELSAARARLTGRVRRTPVLELPAGEFGLPVPVVLKLEQMQHTGAFKARGALNSVLTAPEGTRHVVAASGGNHGAAVAWAARAAGVRAELFIPATSPSSKVELIRSYGAEVHIIEGYYDDALAAAGEYAAAHGAHQIHAFDAAATVAGQATLGFELAEQVPQGWPVIVPCGGGGLYAGTALALAGRNPVLAAEPEQSACLTAALAAGRPVDVEVGGVAVDSLGARRAGAIAVAVAQHLGGRTLTVADPAIKAAQEALFTHLRITAEPGGATALAAALEHPTAPGPLGVAVVVSGANAPR